MQYQVVSNIPDHLYRQDEITLNLWPEFMLHDPISNANWATLFEMFPEYQISLVSNDEIIGVANSIPFYWDQLFEELPEEGWDWVLQKGIQDHKAGVQPNILNGLQIAIPKIHQGKGLSRVVLTELINLARKNGFVHVTVPVRPSVKSTYPLVSIDSYITWRRNDGLSFDPWLRVHERRGGKIIKPCHKAMYIPGTIAEWEEWTGMRFFETGDYIIPGALQPVHFNVENDLGEYIEPNVWVVHEIPD